jgi:hypothetical protein
MYKCINLNFKKLLVKRRKRQATDWEKIFAKDTSQKTAMQNMQRTLKTEQ